MFLKFVKSLAAAGVLWSISSLALAGSFTPAAGSTITPGGVTVAWTSTARQQWVRAYDASGSKIFDSGRQSSSTGQVSFPVAASSSQLRVIFYETNSSGGWTPNERSYPVISGSTDGNSDGGTEHDTGGSTGGGNGAVIVSDRITCSDDTVNEFIMENDGMGHESRPALQCQLSCPSGEILISVDCNAYTLEGTYGAIDGTNEIWSLASDLSFYSPSSAMCSLHGQFDDYLLPKNSFGDPLKSGIAGVQLHASGACMSLPQ